MNKAVMADRIGTRRPTREVAVGCWVQQRAGTWQRYDAADSASPAPVNVFALVPTSAGIVAVGTGRATAGADASVWTLRLQPT